MQEIIRRGTQAVSIYSNDDRDVYEARLWVNCRGDELGTATLTFRRFKSLQGARAFATKKLEEASQ